MRIAQGFAAVLLSLLVSATAIQAAAQATKVPAIPPPSGPKAAYCTSSGGTPLFRHAVYGTNNPVQDWLPLANVEGFCEYIASDGSGIDLSLDTLYTTKPTLAALAYYAQVPWNGQGNGNPASYYCTQLGGSEIGATDFNGGAWVATSGPYQILETCVFPDNSTIDSWGLLYHSVGTIRGMDLSTVLKYANPYAAKKKN